MAAEWDWRTELERWLEPFLAGLSHPARRRTCPLYIAGLIGPGDRKSVQPMAARADEVGYDQLHHFVAAGIWDSAPLDAAPEEADRLVGEPLDRVGQPVDAAEAVLNGRHYEVADLVAAGPAGGRDEAHGLAVAPIERERHPDPRRCPHATSNPSEHQRRFGSATEILPS